jgi:hypothetical protein
MAADFEAEKNGLPPVPPSNHKNRVVARCRRERPRAAMERAVARGRDSTVCKHAFRQIKHTASRARAHRWLPASAAQSPLRVSPASSCSAPHIASRREHEHPGKEGKDKNQSLLDTLQALHENISKRTMISTTRPPALCTAGARYTCTADRALPARAHRPLRSGAASSLPAAASPPPRAVPRQRPRTWSRLRVVGGASRLSHSTLDPQHQPAMRAVRCLFCSQKTAGRVGRPGGVRTAPTTRRPGRPGRRPPAGP